MDFSTVVVRPAQCQRTGVWYMAKRIKGSGREEVRILRLLSTTLKDDPRNHTAFPSAVLWNDRIVVTPLYHNYTNLQHTPNSIMSFMKQLTEVRMLVLVCRISD